MVKKKKDSKKNLNKAKHIINVHTIRKQVRDLFDNHLGVAFTVKQIFNKANLKQKEEKKEGFDVVLDLEQEGAIVQQHNGTFKSTTPPRRLEGLVDHVNHRFAYILCEEQENDIWVKLRDLKNALDGDRVAIDLKQSGRKDQRPEGIVTHVVERKRQEFVGKINVSPRFSFVIPDNRKIYQDILIYPEHIKNAKHGDKVLVKIKEWHGGRLKNPVGKVIKVLGKAGDHEAEIHSIMAEFDLPFKFPKNIEDAAHTISDEITQNEIKKRKDLRKRITFTIDPEDAKDFDDALSVEQLKNGSYEIGVHIADVSHYIPADSLLDNEAIARATSVYLVDRTIPMLPEKLSHGVCSLQAHEDKLTFSILFEITEEGVIKKHWIGRTITHSDRRFTYEEAQQVIESSKGDFTKEILLLNRFAKQFQTQRFTNGAINFETVEVKFQLDETGKPLGIFPKERKDAHKLVEEFMLLANRYVAEFVYQQNQGNNTFIYRVHDNPDPEKVDSFAKFAAKFGHRLKVDAANISHSLNSLMTSIHGQPEQNVLEALAIRAMSKAIYTTDPRGHFGLGFAHYSHFTSPIRRYPDVITHRLLQHYIDGKKSPPSEEYQEICKHTSEREKRAATAERASIKFKQVVFMEMAEDKPFDGIISGVTEWGLFVELSETKCEGLVRAVMLTDDFYTFDEKNYCMVGKRNKRMFTLGDRVTVTVVGTDINRRTIDLKLID